MGSRQNQNTLILLIVSVFMVVVWLGYEIARSYYQSTISNVLEEQTRAFNPKIEEGVLKKLPERLTIPEDRLTQTLDNSIIMPTEKPAATGGGQTQTR